MRTKQQLCWEACVEAGLATGRVHGLEPRFISARVEERRAVLLPGQTYSPFDPPTITGDTVIDVDYALNNPTTVLTPMIIDLAAQRFFVDRVFTNAGGVTGGAVIYNEIEGNDPYAANDVQLVDPGQEFPIITFQRRGIKVATVKKWGGKFPVTDEARLRNKATELANAMRQLTNTIVRKINQAGVEVLVAFVAANSRSISFNNWTTVITVGSSASNHTLWPAHDFGKLDLIEQQEEMGIVYDLLILNPIDYANLVSIYGVTGGLQQILDAFNISIFVTNRVPHNEGYAVASGQVGEMRTEQPLQTITAPDPFLREQTWIQASVRPLMYANNKFAVLHFTGMSP